MRIVRAVEVHIPDALEPSRPARRHKALLDVPRLQRQQAGLQQRARERGVCTLVMPLQREVTCAHRPARTLVAEGSDIPAFEPVVAARPPQRNPKFFRALIQHARRHEWLPRAHRRHAALEDPRLLRRDVPERRPQILRVLQPERGHRARARLDHVGGVETASQAHLDHPHLHVAKREERHQGDDLEERQPRIAQRPRHA